jgi:hypothetical protein
MRRIAGRGGLSGTYLPAGRVIQTDRLCEAGTGQEGKDRGQTPRSRRARFSAATRTYLASVPDSAGYKVHPSADERKLRDRIRLHLPA